MGDIHIGEDVSIGEYCRMQATSSKIIIGDHVMLGPNVSIHGGNHRTDLVGRYMKSVKLNEKRPEDDEDVVIGSDVWIGSNVIILKGVSIGEGSIIGAGCVLSKSVAPYSIVVGNYGRVERKRWDSEQIEVHRAMLAKALRNQRPLSEL